MTRPIPIQEKKAVTANAFPFVSVFEYSSPAISNIINEKG